jgi:hypothetical protein
MGCVGGLGFSLAGGIVLGGLVWLVRIGWGKGNKHDD